MITDLVHASVRSLNQVPAQDGISDRISPLTLITGKGNVDYNKLKLCFGSYVQVFEDNTITNTTAPRSIAAIALAISPNESGSYRFMNLLTGKVLHRRKYKELPLTFDVIEQVEYLALCERQPWIKNGCPQFGWTPEDIIDDEDNDDDDDDADIVDEGSAPGDDDDFPNNDDDDTGGQDPGVDDDNDAHNDNTHEQDNHDHDEDTRHEDNDDNDTINEEDNEETHDDALGDTDEADPDPENIVTTVEEETDDTEDTSEPSAAQRSARPTPHIPDNTQRSAPAHRHNLRGNKRDYATGSITSWTAPKTKRATTHSSYNSASPNAKNMACSSYNKPLRRWMLSRGTSTSTCATTCSRK